MLEWWLARDTRNAAHPLAHPRNGKIEEAAHLERKLAAGGVNEVDRDRCGFEGFKDKPQRPRGHRFGHLVVQQSDRPDACLRGLRGRFAARH